MAPRSAGGSYQRAWEAHQPGRGGALYRRDSSSGRLRSAEPGDPLDYARRVYAEARAGDVHFGEPVEEADRATVEWSATLVFIDGTEQVIAGCSMLRFDDEGLVAECETTGRVAGRRDPPQRLGSLRLGRSSSSPSSPGRSRSPSPSVDRRAGVPSCTAASTPRSRAWPGRHPYSAAVAVAALALVFLVTESIGSGSRCRPDRLSRSFDRLRVGGKPLVPDRSEVRPGRGAALLLAGSLPVLAALTGSSAKGAGLWTLAGTFGLALGPALGGVLTQAFDWRAIFIARPLWPRSGCWPRSRPSPARSSRRVGARRSSARCRRISASGSSSVRSWGRSSWPSCS